MTDKPPFNATIVEGVVQGICVILEEDGQISYAGPLKTAPDVAGKDLCLNIEDFQKLKAIVEKRRH